MKKIKEYRMYILAGLLGIFTFIFSAFSGLVWHWKTAGMHWRATESTYKFMDFLEGESAYNSAGAFEILLIILSVALIVFAILGMLNKMGKIKMGKFNVKDLLMYLTFIYILFALAQVISAGTVVGQNSDYFTSNSYMRIGAGSLLMLFAGIAVATYQLYVKFCPKAKSKSSVVKKSTIKSEAVDNGENVK